MGQSIFQMYAHLVFSVSRRVHLLDVKETKNQIFGYMAKVLENRQSPVIAIGGGEEHVHILHRLPKSMCYQDLMRELKANSSRFAKTHGARYSRFRWQDGYYAVSVSRWDLDMIANYIRKQERHHQTEIYRDEVLRILREAGAEFDERYLWD